MVDFVNVKKRAVSFLPLLFFAAVCMGAVPVHINSGNPAYPFPQFLEYACGGNLGTNVPEGVSHAEMEKYIREAYQQHANLFGYTGDEHQGIKYIEPLNEKNNPAYGTSESDGYALLAAAYMADKTTFDGLWMYTHDALRVVTKKYMDCSDNMPDYLFGDLSLPWRNNRPGDGSWADADVDIALALYVAYKQWGEFMRNDKGEIVKDACDEPISYKQEMINVIRGLVALSDFSLKLSMPNANPRVVNSGVIGLDGYMKDGNASPELTDWALQKENYTLMDSIPAVPNKAKERMHTDYSAPAYFREFHDLLDSLSNELGETNAWEMEQFRRGEASSDWLIGNLIGKSEKAVPTAGQHTVSRYGDTTTFKSLDSGVDFRCPWRTISNYVWHGSPAYSWNPVTHQVENKANTYERDAALRLSDFMRDPAHWTPENFCYSGASPNPSVPLVSGPCIMGEVIDPMTGEQNINTNELIAAGRVKGASSFAAIGAQDYDLMGELFRVIYEQWVVKDTTTADGQLIARYMDGWFRQMGLMALTGNYAAPSQMNPQANLKIYKALKDSMSYCHVGDTITYLLSYRNYGSVDAQNVSIVENVPDGFLFLDADNGGKYDAATHTVKWSLSKLSGFKSDEMEGASIDFSAPNLAKTIGLVSYRCVAKEGAKGRYQASAEISCSNGLGSKTDIYPNYVTATMQRNAIEVVPSGLTLSKSSDVTEVAKGDLITFNVSLSNDTVPALTGGRSGVNVALSEYVTETEDILSFRIYHDAVEPFIDNGNYRISVFKDLKDLKDLRYDFDSHPWNRYTTFDDSRFKLEDVVLADSTHMLTFQFPHGQSVSSIYSASEGSRFSPGEGVMPFLENMSTPAYVTLLLRDPVSWPVPVDMGPGFSRIADRDRNGDLGVCYPVTPSFQTSSEPQPVDRLLRSACDEVSKLTENVLVEEFDGYTWRKILGNSPFGSGDVAKKVTVIDTIPLGFEFVKFMDENAPAKYQPAENKPYAGVVVYSLDSMVAGKSSFSYQCKCVGTDAQTIQLVSYAASDKGVANSAPLTIHVKEPAPLESDPVTVHINSGNPAYPFPQFLEYACGGNLGTKNPEGVSHAEMEKYIREAYQVHANEFAYTGEVYEGIKYIWTPNRNSCNCAESDGYALLAAAYMADKATFDGYWMCTHDKYRVRTKRYKDCTDNAPNYPYGEFSISWREIEGGEASAADADADIALALYVAYKQWGEFMRNDKGEIIKDACGEPISYKQEMINVIRGLVAMKEFESLATQTPRPVLTGIIGLDGYLKDGNAAGELTGWASQEENYIQRDGVAVVPMAGLPEDHYTDYCAPAYYREFHDLLDSLSSELGETNTWEAEQFRRGEASSDWLVGDLISKSDKSLPTAGYHTVSDDGSETTYSSSPFSAGEDFRMPWRTISNYVWHGSPTYSWNPATHQVESKANTYEHDAAVRLSDYMRDPAHWTSDGSCQSYDNRMVPVSGPRMMDLQIDPMTGASSNDNLSNLPLARHKGAFSFAAIGGQDYDLMGDLFSAIYESGCWSTVTDDGRVVPMYMEGWFRQLGLMALTGNYAAPSQMNPQANLKIYKAVKDSMSYCHAGDTITYLLSYRNYGSVDAQNVSIVENVPDGFLFLDADNNGKYDAATHTVKWSLSKLAGFKSDDMAGASIDFSAPNLSKTIGQVSYRCVAKEDAKGRYQTSAEISCSNGLGSKTDLYPNYVTTTMQRNAVDVIPTNLSVAKVADVTEVVAGDLVTFNVNLSNDTVPALTGGRSGVNVALAEKRDARMSTLMLKLYNDAVEPIDYGNYRISVFDGKCRVLPFEPFSSDTLRSVNWKYRFELTGGLPIDSVVSFKIEMLADSSFMRSVQLPHVHAASSSSLMLGNGIYATMYGASSLPLDVQISTYDAQYSDIDWGTGFSQISQDDRYGFHYPVTPSFQTSEEPQPVDRLLESACDEVSTFTENVLVEEFDGYTWRKILGNSPLKGVVAKSVTVTDTIPLGFEFVKFTDENTTATYQPASATTNPRPSGRAESSFRALPDGAKNYSGIVTYTLNSMNTGEMNSFSYQCRVVATESDTIRCASHVTSDKESVNSAPLVLYVKEATSLPSVASESPYVDVYNMLGIMLKKQVLREKALDGLMPGVYVVGDQKMVKTEKD